MTPTPQGRQRPKHVWNVGRWRIAWRFGYYRTGWHSNSPGHLTFGLPFMWAAVIRRNKREDV